jgi:hypothetical protein
MADLYDNLGKNLKELKQREALEEIQSELLKINDTFSLGKEVEYCSSIEDRISDYELVHANQD